MAMFTSQMVNNIYIYIYMYIPCHTITTTYPVNSHNLTMAFWAWKILLKWLIGQACRSSPRLIACVGNSHDGVWGTWSHPFFGCLKSLNQAKNRGTSWVSDDFSWNIKKLMSLLAMCIVCNDIFPSMGWGKSLCHRIEALSRNIHLQMFVI